MASAINALVPVAGTAIATTDDEFRANFLAAKTEIEALQTLVPGAALLLAGGTMTGAMISADGTAAAPGIGVGSATNGLYEYSASVIGFAIGGAVMGGFYASGMWTETAATYLDLQGTAVIPQRANATAASPPEVSGRRARGTIASKSAVQQNDHLFASHAYGWGGTTWRDAGYQLYTAIAATPSETDMQCRWHLYLAASGSGSATEFLRADHASGLSMGGANPVISEKRHHMFRPYTVAGLPSGVTAGETAYATNCRVFNGTGTQEGAAAGTGGSVNWNGSAWKIAGTNVTAVA